MNEEDIKLYEDIVIRHKNIQSNDPDYAFRLSVDSLQIYNYFSEIKMNIKKNLKRGEKPYLKDRLEECCKILFEIYNFSKIIWRQAKEDYRNNKEDL